jgi:hypothetical protein
MDTIQEKEMYLHKIGKELHMFIPKIDLHLHWEEKLTLV